MSRSSSPLQRALTFILNCLHSGSRVFLITSDLWTKMYLLLSVDLENSRKGSLFPNQSILSRPLAENCRIASSLLELISSAAMNIFAPPPFVSSFENPLQERNQYLTSMLPLTYSAWTPLPQDCTQPSQGSPGSRVLSRHYPSRGRRP